MNDRIGGLALVALAVIVGREANRLELGTLSSPGSGLWIALGAAVCGALGVLVALRPADRERFHGAASLRIGGLVGAMVLYAVAIPQIGYLVSTAVFAAAGLVIGGERRVLRVLLTALAIAVATWLVFAQALNVRLP